MKKVLLVLTFVTAGVLYIFLSPHTLAAETFGASSITVDNTSASATTVGVDIQPAVNASGGAAYGARFQQTLNAAANNDSLTALYINPTFNDNGKTGVAHNGLIVASGNVGIGTSSPIASLDVNGSINFSPSTTVKGIIYQNGVQFLHTHDGGVGTVYGTNSLFMGNASGSLANTGQYNVGIGETVMPVLTSGTLNTAVGGHAMVADTTGSNNTAFGVGTLQANTTGDYNTASGYHSQNWLVSGTFNTSSGYLSSYWNAAGAENTAFGASSLLNNLASANTAVGVNSLTANTTGQYNTAVGVGSLGNLSAADGNTAIGVNAGLNALGGGNVFLGYTAGAFETGSNALYIDNQNRGNTAGDKAGALLYGTFNATPSSQTLTINASTTVAQALTVAGTGTSTIAGNVGIGTAAPYTKLDSVTSGSAGLQYAAELSNPGGIGAATGILFATNNGYQGQYSKGGLVYVRTDAGGGGDGDFMFLQNGAGDASDASLADAVVTIKNSGNLGIGTTTPATTLDVNGAATFRTTVNTTNCTSASGTCTSAPAGAVTIAAGVTSVTVSTTTVTSSSDIVVTEDSSMGSRLGVTCNTTLGRTYAVTARSAGTSFTVTASAAPSANPACLSYWIVN